jgi:hypothetical protein
LRERFLHLGSLLYLLVRLLPPWKEAEVQLEEAPAG